MPSRRQLMAATFLMSAALSFSSLAAAAGKRPFDQAAFDAAQLADKPILIEVNAPWCPTCKAQAPILSQLLSQPKFKDMVSFTIDFDSQKALLQKFGVRTQSTLIVFKGKQEVGRSSGDTNSSSIEALLSKSI